MKQFDSTSGGPGPSNIFIGGGLAAVRRTRAARHPERRAVPQRQAAPANVSTNRPT